MYIIIIKSYHYTFRNNKHKNFIYFALLLYFLFCSDLCFFVFVIVVGLHYVYINKLMNLSTEFFYGLTIFVLFFPLNTFDYLISSSFSLFQFKANSPFIRICTSYEQKRLTIFLLFLHVSSYQLRQGRILLLVVLLLTNSFSLFSLLLVDKTKVTRSREQLSLCVSIVLVVLGSVLYPWLF